jgi:hypothetical protein
MACERRFVNLEHFGSKGDLIVIAGHRVGERERIGEILDVLGAPEHVHYRVRWEEGGESVFYPGSDASIRPQSRRKESR